MPCSCSTETSRHNTTWVNRVGWHFLSEVYCRWSQKYALHMHTLEQWPPLFYLLEIFMAFVKHCFLSNGHYYDKEQGLDKGVSSVAFNMLLQIPCNETCEHSTEFRTRRACRIHILRPTFCHGATLPWRSKFVFSRKNWVGKIPHKSIFGTHTQIIPNQTSLREKNR